jgi:hypothetical protein
MQRQSSNGLAFGSLLSATIAPLILAAPVRADALNWTYSPTTHQLEITVSGGTPRYFLAAEPARIVLDLPNTEVDPVATQKTYSTGAIRQIRVAQFQPGQARVVMELAPGTVLAPGQVELRRVNGDRWVLRPLLIGETAAGEAATNQTDGSSRASTAVAPPTATRPAPSSVTSPPIPRTIATPSMVFPGAIAPSSSESPSSSEPPTSTSSGLPPLEPGALAIPVEAPPAQPSAAQSSTVQPSAAQPSTVQPSTIPNSTVQPSTAQPSTIPNSTVQPSTAQPSTGAITLSVPSPGSDSPNQPSPASQPSPAQPVSLASQPSPASQQSSQPSPASQPAATPVPADLPPASQPGRGAVTIRVPAIAPTPRPLQSPLPAAEASAPPVASQLPSLPSQPPDLTAAPAAATPPVYLSALPPVAPSSVIEFGQPLVGLAAAELLIPAGTILNLRHAGSEPIALSSDVSQQEVLLLNEDLRDRSGNVVIPANSEVIGRFETNDTGSQFVAQAINWQDQSLLLNAESDVLRGNRRLLGLLGRSRLRQIQPNQVIKVRLTEDLSR